MNKPLLFASLLAPVLAFGQASQFPLQSRFDGLTLPPTNAALADESTAPNLNPAGIALLDGPMLVYQHERNLAVNSVGDGVYLGTTWFGFLGTGLSLEWLRGDGLPSQRKTTWSLGLGNDAFALGAGLNLFSSDLRGGDGPTTWDLGVTSRPLRALSVGLAVKDVGESRSALHGLGRHFDVAVGVRPWGERVTLGANYTFANFERLDDANLAGVVQAEVIPGVVLGGSLAHGIQASDAWSFQLSLTLNTAHAGIGYAFGHDADRGSDHLISARLSAARYLGLPLGVRRVALIDVGDILSGGGTGALALLGFREEDPYLRLSRLLRRAARDPGLAGVILKLDGLPGLGMGNAEELRQTVLKLRASGKTVAAMLYSAGDKEYLVASAADRVWAAPQAFLQVNGLTAGVTFLGDTMQKLGVHWDVARVGAYKNAPDQLTRATMAREQREALNAFLDVQVSHFESAVSQIRKLPVERLRAAQAEGLATPRRAVELGLVDEVVNPAGLEEISRALVPGGRYEGDYRPRAPDRRWGIRRRIAVVPVLGGIAGGKSREDPLGLAKIAGSETVARALRDASEDPGVAAIVVRVDSGGGDGLASDLMYRAVLDAKTRKPVVASMGDVAASGGYYAAMGADAIYASPTTLTGSIGVFVIKPAAQELAAKLGIHQETLPRGPLADLLGIWRPWTAPEQTAVQRWVDGFYADFVSEVASARKLDRAQVDAVARGRIWAGSDAKARGLVDALGGLADALADARKRAGVPDQEELDVETVGAPAGLLSALVGEDGVLSRVGLAAPTSALTPAMKALAAEFALPPLIVLEPGLKAALPFTLRVE